jgi:acetyltransferase-like isoleucine patch superfamily enzyme
MVLERTEPGPVVLEDSVHLYGDTYIQTGRGGSVVIGENTHIQRRCYFSIFLGSVRIGKNVEIAPNCAFYAHNHGMELGQLIMDQPIFTKGGSSIGDGAWLGHGVIVLDGAHVGAGAIIGAGSVVARDIPENAIAVGAPARVIKMRDGQRTGDRPQTIAQELNPTLTGHCAGAESPKGIRAAAHERA